MKAVSCSDNPIKGRQEAATDALGAAEIIESVDKFQTSVYFSRGPPGVSGKRGCETRLTGGAQ